MPDPDVYAERALRDRPPWGTLEQLQWLKDRPLWFKDENWGEDRHRDQVAPMGVYLNPVTGSKYRGAPIAHPMNRHGVHTYVVPGTGSNAYTIIYSYPADVINPLWHGGPDPVFERLLTPAGRVTQNAQYANGQEYAMRGDFFDVGQPPRESYTPPQPPAPRLEQEIDEFHSELPIRPRPWRTPQPTTTQPEAMLT